MPKVTKKSASVSQNYAKNKSGFLFGTRCTERVGVFCPHEVGGAICFWSGLDDTSQGDDHVDVAEHR